MIRDIIVANTENFRKILLLARADQRRKNRTSDLGMFWAIAKPLMYMLMFYFAISFGFRSSKNIDGLHVPYYVWLTTGIAAWFYIQALLTGGAGYFNRNKKLLNGSHFPITAVPMIAVLSELYVHLITMAFVIILAFFLGARPNVYWLQLPLIIFINIVFLYFWSLMTALLNILSADIMSFIRSIKPAFFWLSGILFNSRATPRKIFRLNPITFIVEGYRDSLCFDMWIWEDHAALKGFLFVMVLLLLFTGLLYHRLKDRVPELI